MTGAQIPDNLTPYANGSVPAPARGSRGNEGTRPASAAKADRSVEPYAQGEGNQARYEAAQGVGAKNTDAGSRGETIDCGVFTDGNSLQVPGDVTPYAGTSNTSARRCDAAGE